MPRHVNQDEWNYWYNKVYGYFFRRIADKYQVEELTSTTLTDFFLRDKEVESEHGYLWRIARCNFLDYIRFKDAKKNQWQTSDHIEESEEEDMHYNPYYLERIEALKECIQKTLQSQDQQIVEMCVMYDFSSGEVSAETGLKPDNVRKRLSRGLKKVKDKCRQIWFLEQVK